MEYYHCPDCLNISLIIGFSDPFISSIIVVIEETIVVHELLFLYYIQGNANLTVTVK